MSILEFKSLTTLKLSKPKNTLTMQHFKEINVKQQQLNDITQLELSKTLINVSLQQNQQIGYEIIDQLFMERSQKTYFKHIFDYQDFCQLRGQQIKQLVNRQWDNLQQLNLNSNFIDSNASMLLFKHNWKNLIILNLNFNCVGDEGMKNYYFHELSNLEQFNLGYNDISHKGIYYFIRSQHKHLKLLNLLCNKLKHRGILQLLYHQLLCMEKQSLNIACNGIGNRPFEQAYFSTCKLKAHHINSKNSFICFEKIKKQQTSNKLNAIQQKLIKL